MAGPLGSRLKAAREVQGWTQALLAGASELSERQIQRIEAGECEPSPETVLALAGALGIEVSELRTGFTSDDLAELRQAYLCPHCGSKLAERTFVPHEYGDDEVEVFECGFTRGMARRPCPTEPRFPKFEDVFREEGEGDWWCYALGQTEAAREVPLQAGRGRTMEAAAKWVKRSYIWARHGSEAAQEFLPF